MRIMEYLFDGFSCLYGIMNKIFFYGFPVIEEGARLAGNSALIRAYDLKVPMPDHNLKLRTRGQELLFFSLIASYNMKGNHIRPNAIGSETTCLEYTIFVHFISFAILRMVTFNIYQTQH